MKYNLRNIPVVFAYFWLLIRNTGRCFSVILSRMFQLCGLRLFTRTKPENAEKYYYGNTTGAKKARPVCPAVTINIVTK